MKQDELKLVLEALKWCHGGEPCGTAEAIVVVEKALAQPEQEPVAWRAPKWSNLQGEYGYRDFNDPVIGIDGKPSLNNEPLYIHPPQRIWVGLTGEEAMDVTRKEGHELLDFIYEYGTGSEGVEERIVAICKAIEAKLKQKNGYAEEKNT